MSTTGWQALPPEQRELIAATLTPPQLEAVKLHMNGAGYKRIGRALGISPQAAQARVDGARRRLGKLVDDQAANAA